MYTILHLIYVKCKAIAQIIYREMFSFLIKYNTEAYIYVECVNQYKYKLTNT